MYLKMNTNLFKFKWNNIVVESFDSLLGKSIDYYRTTIVVRDSMRLYCQ